MQSKIILKFLKMAKQLIVIKPFYMMEVGDILELNSKGTEYVSSYNEEMDNSADDGADVYGSYSSTFKISAAYAKDLIDRGYLKSADEDPKNTQFVNVFTEIDNLLDKYQDEMDNLDEDFATMPQCLKVEKATVLDNMITVLKHLKNLKK